MSHSPKSQLKGFSMLCLGSFLLFLTLLRAPVSAEDKPKISNPSKFKVGYSLSKPSSPAPRFGAPGLNSAAASVASVAVNILDERFVPVKTYILKDVKSQDRLESLWDGRDIYGKEMPAGNYFASLSIIYSDGSKGSRMFRFVKD